MIPVMVVIEVIIRSVVPVVVTRAISFMCRMYSTGGRKRKAEGENGVNQAHSSMFAQFSQIALTQMRVG